MEFVEKWNFEPMVIRLTYGELCNFEWWHQASLLVVDGYAKYNMTIEGSHYGGQAST